MYVIGMLVGYRIGRQDTIRLINEMIERMKYIHSLKKDGKNKLLESGKLMHRLGGFNSPAWQARKHQIAKRIALKEKKEKEMALQRKIRERKEDKDGK